MNRTIFVVMMLLFMNSGVAVNDAYGQDVMRNPNPVMSRCTCEDWDHDGRYGIVRDGQVLQGNIGPLEQCRRAIS